MKNLIALLAFCLAYLVATAQAPRYWGNLQPGPHPVGFKVLFLSDSTRIYRPQRDILARESETLYRPIRIYLWYPAQVGPENVRMKCRLYYS